MSEKELEQALEKDRSDTDKTLLKKKAEVKSDSDISTSNKKTSWFLMVIVSVICSVVSIFIYDRFFAQKVVAFDLKGFIAQQRDLSLSGKLTDEQFKANLDYIEALINSVPKRKVILMGDVVIRNAEMIDEKGSVGRIK